MFRISLKYNNFFFSFMQCTSSATNFAAIILCPQLRNTSKPMRCAQSQHVYKSFGTLLERTFHPYYFRTQEFDVSHGLALGTQQLDNSWFLLNAYKQILGHVFTVCEPLTQTTFLLS
jgi:hypothetical protein